MRAVKNAAGWQMTFNTRIKLWVIVEVNLLKYRFAEDKDMPLLNENLLTAYHRLYKYYLIVSRLVIKLVKEGGSSTFLSQPPW